VLCRVRQCMQIAHVLLQRLHYAWREIVTAYLVDSANAAASSRGQFPTCNGSWAMYQPTAVAAVAPASGSCSGLTEHQRR
jgi:hypothetical protein